MIIDEQNLLRIMRINLGNLESIDVKDQNNDELSFYNPKSDDFDKILTNEYRIIVIVFKSANSWIFKYTKRQLELLNTNGSLQYLNIHKERKNRIRMAFKFI